MYVYLFLINIFFNKISNAEIKFKYYVIRLLSRENDHLNTKGDARKSAFRSLNQSNRGCFVTYFVQPRGYLS